MRSLLSSDRELVVKSGFLYFPLLFDPAVESEIGQPPPDILVERNERFFVKALTLQSILDNYERIDPEGHRELKNHYFEERSPGPGIGGFSIGRKLGTILFDVAPRYVRRKRRLGGRRLDGEGVLDLIGERIRIPPKYYEEAARLADTDSVRRRLRDLERQETGAAPPGDGPISGDELLGWIRRALAARVAEAEKDRLRRALAHRQSLASASPGQIALRLYIAGEGSLEIDGFGFSRIGGTDEYIVYKRTGEYALKDYYGRLYLFPDCRVAVSTIVPLRPFVMETYKHPFLESHDSGQPICLRDFDPPRVFTGAAVIRALEEGIHALLHGYSSRRRNGYHSLDGRERHAWTADPEDDDALWQPDYPVVRGRRIYHVDFDEYLVPNDHPGIASGEIGVTNDLTP